MTALLRRTLRPAVAESAVWALRLALALTVLVPPAWAHLTVRQAERERDAACVEALGRRVETVLRDRLAPPVDPCGRLESVRRLRVHR